MAADFVSATPDAGASIMSADYVYAQWNFVANLVKVFPSLVHRPLYLTGESYAGRYIVSDSVDLRFESTLA
jgi:carboxypeptidase C (cathepsin A)